MVMKQWDCHSGETSVATSLAVFWGSQLMPFINAYSNADIVERTNAFAADTANAKALLKTFYTAMQNLHKNYGTWQVEWGTINRFQRISNEIDSKFDDNAESIPVGFTSSAWGQLCSYTSRQYANTKKLYGVNGNSFICAVEFGKKLKQSLYWQVAKVVIATQSILKTRQQCTVKEFLKKCCFIKKMY